MVQSPVLRHFVRCLEPGLRPSAGITRLHRYHEPLRHPAVPGLSLAGIRLDFTLVHIAGLPVLRLHP
jgi:hypothetical protein